MIHSLELENFKAFGKRCHIRFAPITLIFGQNSAGKSSILQALQLLKQTLESRDYSSVLLPRVENGIVDLGSFQELIFDHDLERTLNIKVESDYDFHSPMDGMYGTALDFTFQRPTEKSDISLKNINLYYYDMDKPLAQFKPLEKSPKDRQANLLALSRSRQCKCTWINQSKEIWEPIYNIVKKPKARKHIHKALKRLDPVDSELCNLFSKDFTLSSFIKQLTNHQKKTLINIANFIPSNSEINKISEIIDDTFFYDEFERIDSSKHEKSYRAGEYYSYSHFLDIPRMAWGAGECLRDNLDWYFTLGPFRHNPQRYYIFSGTTPYDVGYSGDLMPDLLFRNPSILDKTNEWLRKLEIGYQLKVASISKKMQDLFAVRLIDTRRGRNVEVNLSDVGYGVSQILPLIVQSLTDDISIISIEQPEVHIHPRLQADLGDLLADSIEPHTLGEPKQFIIETHSEHLILRIQRLIRKSWLKASDVSIIYVSRGKDGSVVHHLELNSAGEFIDDWPEGFFTERLREL